ncbi:L-rhamnose-binding lectin CSL2-like protein [Labeo rohita]|uniref:L-rhamnose-binding lectin CSL2-like protein n=1 Tax=Labeo rohita TaxID=84645 RepID=A0A498MLZ2_LABRO|nr:L-rhamnose-binding lectin CSL2-like protein [Labeo rohita]
MFSLSVLLLTLMLLNSGLLISADTGVISVQSTTYGRTSSLICSFDRTPSEISNTQCSVDVSAVSKRCEGKNSCSILASNSVFSDPCFGTFKYLYISYTCESKCKCYCTE